MYLNSHSYYSLRYGTLSPQELVAAAATAGHKVIALTDINNTSAASDFIKACDKHEIKPVIGIEFREGEEYRYTGIARNAEGFRELCSFLTDCSLQRLPIPTVAPAFDHAFIIYRSLPKQLEHFSSNEFFGVRPGEVNKLFSSSLLSYPDKLVIFSPVTFENENGWRAHKLLRCIDLNIVLSKLKPKSCAQQSEMFMSPEKLKAFFEQYPHILLNTQHLLDRCDMSMPTGYEVNRRAFTGNKADDYKLLNKLAIEGCRRRYGLSNHQAMKRIKSELHVIQKMDFAPYFLITWDIIRYAQSSGYHHVGRGSGANSIVAYCLHITDVDPLELDLYFERFINPHRTSPPDFDIDFSWDERDDVTDYIFKRYGREYTALLATYNTFKGKSVIRELGKVFGLPKADIDLIVEQPMNTEKHHAFARHIFHYGKMITGFPNYLSIHAGGIIISEQPLNYHTALQMMPKGFPITHFDMYAAEDIGFHKFDILSQRGLGHIKEAVDIINTNHGKTVDIHNVDAIKRDEKVRTQLRSAHCIGCFYIESPAMRGLISKLRCDNYLHLVAASSIIRPGVAKSGMMREYIKRYHKPQEIEYLHPVFEKHLGETFGIMVYQEDVMKIVHHFADLDLDESDILRRIMTGKRKSSDTFRRLRDKYFKNCKTIGYPDGLTQEVWRQIESFSGYSFCKAHSASFAVESFQSLYLKTYYPKEFMVAVINNFGGFYHTELYFHEARMCGAHIEAPCINHSTFLTNITADTIYVGFVHMKDFEQRVAREIVAERRQNGVFRSLGDFVNRVDIKKEQLEILVRIDAFRFTGKNKYELMWEKSREHNPQQHYFGTELLFPVNTETVSLPEMTEGSYEQAFDEIEILGFPLCSPFDLLEEKQTGDILSDAMKNHMGRIVEITGYYVTRKYVTTVNKKLMNFGTWVDREGHFFDTVHFPQALERSPFLGRGCYRIRGKIVEDFGFPSMEAHSMEKLPYVRDERY